MHGFGSGAFEPDSKHVRRNVRRNVRRGARRHGRVRFCFTDRAAPGSATPATEEKKPWRTRHYPRAADTKPPRGGQAAAVAGYAGPGFHNWPTGHIPQAPDTNEWIRIRRVRTGLKTRSEKRSEKRSERRTPTRSNPFLLHRPGGSGVSEPSYRRTSSLIPQPFISPSPRPPRVE